MNKLALILVSVSTLFLFGNFTYNPSEQLTGNPDETETYNMPEEVNTIIQNSCYGCHNTDSKNDKGKKKLDFDKLGTEYSLIKSSGKLKDISKTLIDNEMPPEKFLAHYPEKALSEDDKKTLTDWAQAESSKLLGK